MPTDMPHSLLEELEGRRFSFYPAIRGIEHNEWSLMDSTWSEVQVRNSHSAQEFWIPKSHVGGVSSSDSPVVILGLRRELELKAGGIYPYRNVVTEIPSTQAGRRSRVATAAPPRQRLFSGSDAKHAAAAGHCNRSGAARIVAGLSRGRRGDAQPVRKALQG